MPSVTDTVRRELGDEVLYSRPAPNGSHEPDPSQEAPVPSHADDAEVMSSGSQMPLTSRAQNGTNATKLAAHSTDTGSTSPQADRESEEEPGAFDDLHLQVDQPKNKKKKKKKSKKPKSQRGLVIPSIKINLR